MRDFIIREYRICDFEKCLAAFRVFTLNHTVSDIDMHADVFKKNFTADQVLISFSEISICISRAASQAESLVHVYAEILLPSFSNSPFSPRRRKLLDEKMTRFPPRLRPFASSGPRSDANFSPELESSPTNGV